MGDERKILALVAVVGSLVACFPSVCCLGFFAFAGFAALVADPRMIEAAAGTTGDVPTRATFVVMGLGSSIGALIALVAGIALLVWGIRALRQARVEEGEQAVM